MIRKDFIDGGFPISRKSPVICTDLSVRPDKGISLKDLSRSVLCYNRFDLKKSIEEWSPNIECIGIWPGKKTTDGFILNPDVYKKYAPPEIFKDIDSADSITVIFNTDNIFNRILYTPGTFSDSQVPVMSTDRALYEYAVNVGLKFRAVID